MPFHLDHDWYSRGVPGNVVLGEDVYLDSSYGFAAFHSEREPGAVFGEACGAYDRATLVVGPRGQVTVGPYTVLNGVYLVCSDRISIGAHCLLAWGAVLTDSWRPERMPPAARREALRATAADPRRIFPTAGEPAPVTVEDGVWVGFDSVVLPGVTLGRGCVVGCRTVVGADVPPYAVVAGSPARVLRSLEPDDTDDVRRRALAERTRA
ncbi:MAG: acyltransferase [Gemmatimonadetes bacterium]|nr:acyltransferase [Gemmatimonadota bacterium]